MYNPRNFCFYSFFGECFIRLWKSNYVDMHVEVKIKLYRRVNMEKTPWPQHYFHLNLLEPSQNFVSTQWDEILYEMPEIKISTFCDVTPKCCIVFANSKNIVWWHISSLFSSMFGVWSKTPPLLHAFYQNTLFINRIKKPTLLDFCDFISPTLSKGWAPHSAKYTLIIYGKHGIVKFQFEKLVKTL